MGLPQPPSYQLFLWLFLWGCPSLPVTSYSYGYSYAYPDSAQKQDFETRLKIGVEQATPGAGETGILRRVSKSWFESTGQAKDTRHLCGLKGPVQYSFPSSDRERSLPQVVLERDDLAFVSKHSKLACSSKQGPPISISTAVSLPVSSTSLSDTIKRKYASVALCVKGNGLCPKWAWTIYYRYLL